MNVYFKCPYCDKTYRTYNGLCKHVISHKAHGDGIDKNKLLADFAYDGVRPKCKCGCGEYTEIDYVGNAHFREYKQGHISRIHNNWGNNPKAIENSSNARRKQFESGERQIWNKGKSWNETYSNDKQDELLHMERNKIYRMLKERKFSLSSRKEDEFVLNCIEPLSINYTRQFYIKDINQFCDVCFEELKLIIEFNGDYWHGNPSKFNKDKLNEQQKKKICKDSEKLDWCINNGYTLLTIWENDYDTNISMVNELIAKTISNVKEDSLRRV